MVFKTADKMELNQISLTGIRALVLLGLLMEAPRTLEEIRETFIHLNIMEPEHSDDILRIDLNTLRAMGCEISRAGQKTDFKYVLQQHPFALNITHEEIALLKRVYKKVKDSSNVVLLVKYNELFAKLANYVADIEIKEELHGLSALKSFNVKMVNELIEDCKNNKILKILYKNPIAKEASAIDIAAEKIVFQNDKLYLYGFDFAKKASVTLNIKRILSILSKNDNFNGIKTNPVTIKFILKNADISELDENETILKKNGCEFTIIGKYHNEFIAMQRILSFGSRSIVLEPNDFRQDVIQKLKSMRKNYNG